MMKSNVRLGPWMDIAWAALISCSGNAENLADYVKKQKNWEFKRKTFFVFLRKFVKENLLKKIG